MSAQSKGTASSSSSPSEGPPAASKAKVKEQIKIIVEDLELVLGDLKDVAKELKEVRMRGCAGGPLVCPVWGERPSPAGRGPGSPGALLPPPGSFCRFFTAGRATGVQAGHGAAPGRAPGRAAGHRRAARRPERAGAPCPGCRASRDRPCSPRLRGRSTRGLPTSGHPSEFYFSRGVSVLSGPCWARKVVLGELRDPQHCPIPG